ADAGCQLHHRPGDLLLRRIHHRPGAKLKSGNAVTMTKRYKGLVAGASGVVGRRLAEYMHSLPEWDVIALSRKEPLGGSPVPRIAVDLGDAQDVKAKL